jgi:hypothetical protein
MENLPNKNYDHVYVVLRCDTFEVSKESRICVLKIFLTEKEAIEEVNRLQKLITLSNTSAMSTVYFYQLGRIKKGILTTSSSQCGTETKFGRKLILSILRKKFTQIPQRIETVVQQINSPRTLELLVIDAAVCQTLDEFINALK